jgi:hypothetical protein
VVSGQWSGGGLETTDDGQWTAGGLDLMHALMHEIGHLLGYEHSVDGLMAPVLGVSLASDPGSRLWTLDSRLSEVVQKPLNHWDKPSGKWPSSRVDDVFAGLGADGSEDTSSALLASEEGGLLAVATSRPSEEATQARVPRRSRLQRYERELDAWFAELAEPDTDA